MASNRRAAAAAAQLSRLLPRKSNVTSIRSSPFNAPYSCCIHSAALGSQKQPLRVGSFPPSIKRFMSSSASSAASNDDNVNVTTSLKNMIKPFFLKCHPDVQSTAAAKRVNLQALQTINGLLDITQATCEGRVVEWPESLEVEFLIVLEERVKKDIVESTSRRKVELALPSQSLRDAVVQSPRDARAIRRLHHHVKHEFAKLLKVAGLPVPVMLLDEDNDDSIDQVWKEELDFMGERSNTRTFTPYSRYEQSRQRFVKNVDWKRIHRLTQEAVADMEADLATEGSIRNNTRRRQAVITNILQKVRVAQGADIPMLEQLICFRRMSLILEDNFDELYMEDMGRMWENLVIVLKGARDYNTSSSAMRKRTKRAQESGFSFSYGTNGVVTIHIPIDFRDEELVAELDRNLWDFYNLVGDGVEELYPKWFTEQS